MTPEQATISVMFDAVPVADAVAAIRRINDLFDRLWAAGRLRPVTEAAEGHEAVQAFTSVFLSAMRQINEADAAGHETVAVVVEVPASARETLLAFAQRLLTLMADEDTMKAMAVDPLSEQEMAFILGFMRRAEDTLALP